MGADRIGDIGRRHAHHQQSTIGIDGNVALAAVDPFRRTVASAGRARRFDRRTVDDGGRRLFIAPV